MGLAGGGLLLVAGGASLAGGGGSQPAPRDPIPLERGFYAQEQWQCARAPNLFRFEGERMGWLFSDGGDNFSLPAEVELEPDGRYRIYIQNIDIDPAVHPDSRFEFHLRPAGLGRAVIRVHEDRMYRLCPADQLPAWARRHL